MQATSPDTKRKYVVPAIAVFAIFVVVLLSNRPGKMTNGLPIIETDAQYDDSLEHVTKITKTAVGKFNVGQELDQADKDAVLLGAKNFDAMNAYRPDLAAGYYEAGLLYYLAGDSDKALERLNQSLQDSALPGNLKRTEDKNDVEAIAGYCHQTISLICFDRQDFATALDEASAALDHYSKSPKYNLPRMQAYVSRAQAEVQLKKLHEAKKDLAAALAIDPTYIPAKRLAGFLAH